MNGSELIAQERKRQVDQFGYTDQNNAENWPNGEMANSAIAFAFTANGTYSYCPRLYFSCKKPDPADGRIKLLTKAGALIAAEIDRLIYEELQNGSA